MDNKINHIEENNLNFFQKDDCVETIYNTYGLTPLEADLLKKYFNIQGGTILDIGCGRGRTTVPLHNMGYKIIGIDPAEKMISAAKRDYPHVDFRVGDACKLAFPENAFDFALFSFNGIDCIYPEKKRLGAFKEIFRVLRPGGIFIFSSHNTYNFFPASLRSLFFLIKFYLFNIIRFTLLSKYRLDPFKTGILTIYHTSPKKQKKQIENTGFILLDIKSEISNKFLSQFGPSFYYITKK